VKPAANCKLSNFSQVQQQQFKLSVPSEKQMLYGNSQLVVKKVDKTIKKENLIVNTPYMNSDLNFEI